MSNHSSLFEDTNSETKTAEIAKEWEHFLNVTSSPPPSTDKGDSSSVSHPNKPTNAPPTGTPINRLLDFDCVVGDTRTPYDGLTLLMMASARGSLSSVKALFEFDRDECANGGGHAAAAVMKASLALRSHHSNRTALAYAVRGGHVNVVRYLLEMGASVDALQLSSLPPPFASSNSSSSAAPNNSSATQCTSTRNNVFFPKVVSSTPLLIEALYQFQSTISDVAALNPSSSSSSSDSLELFKLLLAAGADVNTSCDRQKVPAPFIAAKLALWAALLLMLEVGLDINTRENKFESSAAVGDDGNHEKNQNEQKYVETDQDNTTGTTVSEELNVEERVEVALGSLGRTLLHYAVLSHELEVVERLLDLGAEVNSQDAAGNTPLMLAAKGADQAIAIILLTAGADVNTATFDQGPIFVVDDLENEEDENGDGSEGDAHNGSGTYTNSEELDGSQRGHRYRSYNGLDDEAIKRPSVTPCSPTYRTCTHFISSPLENTPFDGRQTALHMAVLGPSAASSFLIVRLLVRFGADVNSQDGYGCTPLHTALNRERKEIAGFLASVPGANLEIMCKDAHDGCGAELGGTALFCAARAGYSRLVELLLSLGANPNTSDRGQQETPFLSAAKRGHISIMRSLEAAGADVHARNRRTGANVLIHILSRQDWPHEGLSETLRLDPTLDVNARDYKDWTPLMHAASEGDGGAVSLLLEAGADINSTVGKGGDGSTPLLCSVYASVPSALWSLLTFAQQSKAAKRRANSTKALTMTTNNADSFREKEELLFDFEARRSSDGATALVYCGKKEHREQQIEMLALAGANINAQDNNGMTALMWASEAGYEATVRTLMSLGANRKLKNIEGKTALGLSHDEVVKRLLTAN